MLVPKLRFKREDGTDYPEWEEKCIKEIAPLQRGFDLPEKERINGEYPVVCSNGIVAYHNQYKCEGYAVVTGRSGTIGTFTYLDNCKYWAHNTSLWVTDFCGNHPKFIYYFYHTIRIEQYATGTGVPTLNRNNVHSSRHYIPCLEEQQKIADFLSTVDEVIAQSEAEVQNLEQQKKAAMQKIFSQEVRFKREDETDYPEWRNKSFANAFIPLNNNTFSRDMLSENGTVLNIHYGDILVKFGEVCDIQTMDIPKVNADIDTSKYDVLQDGDIILADTAEDETVGKAIEIYHTGTSKVVSGLHTMVCRPNDKYAPKYMGYYINSPTYHNQLLPYMQGIKVTSIGRKNIADTVIYYPADLEEQQKIADFLSAYDEAISYAKQELEHWKQLKKGLLQQMFV